MKGIFNRNAAQNTVWKLKHSMSRYSLIWSGVWGGNSLVSEAAIYSLDVPYINL